MRCYTYQVIDLTDIERLSLHTLTLLLINLPDLQVNYNHAQQHRDLHHHYHMVHQKTPYHNKCYIPMESILSLLKWSNHLGHYTSSEYIFHFSFFLVIESDILMEFEEPVLRRHQKCFYHLFSLKSFVRSNGSKS